MTAPPAEDPFINIKSAARKARERFSFSSETLPLAPNMYVAWIDLMGAGHLMSTSVQKTANFLARLHMAVGEALEKSAFKGTTIAINDGMFLISPKKEEIMVVVRDAMALLSLFFVSVPRPHDRFFVRSGIAFGPVYFGSQLIKGIKAKTVQARASSLNNVAFGPPVIAAYRSESSAPPFGVAIHESARSFAPTNVAPFRMTHWLWWQNQEEIDLPKNSPPLPALKDLLLLELNAQFDWMLATLIFSETTKEKIEFWRSQSKQYFSLA